MRLYHFTATVVQRQLRSERYPERVGQPDPMIWHAYVVAPGPQEAREILEREGDPKWAEATLVDSDRCSTKWVAGLMHTTVSRPIVGNAWHRKKVA